MNNSVNFDKWICSLGNISLANQDIEHFSYQKVFCVISGSYSLQRQLFFWFLTLQISSAFSELSIHVIIEHVLSVSVSFTQLKISRCVHVVHEICSFLLLSISCMCGQLLQLCPTLCDPLDCSLPGSSVPGISQARILEWSAMPFSRGSSQPRDQTRVSCLADRFFTHWAKDLASIIPLCIMLFLFFKRKDIWACHFQFGSIMNRSAVNILV